MITLKNSFTLVTTNTTSSSNETKNLNTLIERFLSHTCFSFLSEFINKKDFQEKVLNIKTYLSFSFYSLLANKTNYTTFMTNLSLALNEHSLKESTFELPKYDSIVRENIQHEASFFSYDSIEKDSNETIIFKIDDSLTLTLNKLLVLKSLLHDQRLDLYLKIHILDCLINEINSKNGEIKEQDFPFIKTIKKGTNNIIHYLKLAEKSKFTIEEYSNKVTIFTREKDLSDEIEQLFNLVKIYQNSNDKQSINLVEKLATQLLGHWENGIVEDSISLLNMINDNTSF